MISLSQPATTTTPSQPHVAGQPRITPIWSEHNVPIWDGVGPPPAKISRDEVITPEAAFKIITDLGKTNRPVSNAVVSRYKALYANGGWKAGSALAIVFDWNGKLHDGYHRLTAVYDAGIPVTFYVTYNEDPATFDVYDQPKRRTIADKFAIAGGKVPDGANHNRITSIARRMVFGLQNGNRAAGATSGVDEKSIVDFALTHQDVIRQVFDIARKYKGRRYNAGWPAAFAKACLVYGTAKVIPLLVRFSTQSWTDDKDPLKRLHLKLAEVESSSGDRKRKKPVARNRERLRAGSPDYMIYPYAVSAVRAAVENRQISSLYAAQTDFTIP